MNVTDNIEKKSNKDALANFTLCIIASYVCANHYITLFYGRHDVYLSSFIKAALHYGSSPSFIMITGYLILIFAPLLLLIFIAPAPKAKNKYGSASFAKQSHLEDMGLLTGKGIVLGKENKNINPHILTYDEPRSTLIVAPRGTGKTRSIAVPAILSVKNETVIVHDVKGELASFTAKYRSQYSKNYFIQSCR